MFQVRQIFFLAILLPLQKQNLPFDEKNPRDLWEPVLQGITHGQIKASMETFILVLLEPYI